MKKLQLPITELISTTPAISLLYECVHTCIIGGMLQGSSGDSLAKLCVSKLATFIQDADQNRGPSYSVFLFPTESTLVSVKYIALLAMAKIVPTHPHLITEYQDTIFTSINDQDISIRMRALDLLSAMVNLIFEMLENTAYKTYSRPIVEIYSPLSNSYSHTLFETLRHYPQLRSPWLRMRQPLASPTPYSHQANLRLIA